MIHTLRIVSAKKVNNHTNRNRHWERRASKYICNVKNQCLFTIWKVQKELHCALTLWESVTDDTHCRTEMAANGNLGWLKMWCLVAGVSAIAQNSYKFQYLSFKDLTIFFFTKTWIFSTTVLRISPTFHVYSLLRCYKFVLWSAKVGTEVGELPEKRSCTLNKKGPDKKEDHYLEHDCTRRLWEITDIRFCIPWSLIGTFLCTFLQSMSIFDSLVSGCEVVGQPKPRI